MFTPRRERYDSNLSNDPNDDENQYSSFPKLSADQSIAYRLQQWPMTWLMIISMAVLTTKHLFVQGFHFPILLLVCHITVALLAICSWNRSLSGQILHQRQRVDLLQLCRQLLFIGSVTTALILSYQAVLHVRNTTFLLMALTMPWRPMKGETGADNALWNGVRHVTIVLCGFVLFLNEDQLVDRTEWSWIISALCIVLARITGPDQNSAHLMTSMLPSWDIRIYSLITSLLGALYAWYIYEKPNVGDFESTGLYILLLLNLACGAGTIFGVLGFEVSSFSVPMESGAFAEEKSSKFVFLSAALVGLIQLDNVAFQTRPARTSVMQWFAYAVALATCIDSAHLRSVVGVIRKGSEKPKSLPMSGMHLRCQFNNEFQDLPWRVRAVLDITLNCLAWALLITSIININADHTVPSAAHAPSVQYDLDVVVARYNEPIAGISHLVSTLLDLSNIAPLSVRLNIYNKNPSHLKHSELEMLSTVTNNLTVTNKPNLGREGETFLSHITDSWDDLAPHTLFTQAAAEDPHWMLARVRDYFTPSKTGFLTLSYPDTFCSDCNRCSDLGFWISNPAEIKRIFQASIPDESCKDLSLTYRGQFIISSQRIKGIGKQVFEDLRQDLARKEEFGFTLERLWGVVMQCPRISSMCPSLFSGALGRMGPGGRADCQCFD